MIVSVRTEGCHIVGCTPASSGIAAHAALPAGHQLAGHSRGLTKRTRDRRRRNPSMRSPTHLLHPRRRFVATEPRQGRRRVTDGQDHASYKALVADRGLVAALVQVLRRSTAPSPIPTVQAFPRPREERTALTLTARGCVVP